MSLRCPNCETALLNTACIIVQMVKKRKRGLPIKVCRHCMVILVGEATKSQDWKIWNGKSYVNYMD